MRSALFVFDWSSLLSWFAPRIGKQILAPVNISSTFSLKLKMLLSTKHSLKGLAPLFIEGKIYILYRQINCFNLIRKLCMCLQWTENFIDKDLNLLDIFFCHQRKVCVAVRNMNTDIMLSVTHMFNLLIIVQDLFPNDLLMIIELEKVS